jgi:hypothetical protein
MNRHTVVALAALVVLALIVLRSSHLRAVTDEGGIRIALVYTPQEIAPGDAIRAAYSESFRESGIRFDWIASTDISLFGAAVLHRMYDAIVFPDGINRRLPEEATLELTRYAQLGGSVAILSDAGSRSNDGSYRPGSLFASLSGVDNMLYHKLRAGAFGSGPMHFQDAATAQLWQVPAGKLMGGDLSGYQYGPLTYPFPRAEIDGTGVIVDARNGTSPMITRRPVGAGLVTYIALPLGYLRDYTDAFPMTFLTSLLTSRDTLPHLVAAPDGIGQLIVNLHIDSSVEFMGIPNLQRRGLLRHEVPMEFDVTAGPDLDRVGDGLGFNACGPGPGRADLKVLMRFGAIGSHGGWAHNWFAVNLAGGRFSRAQLREYVDRNDRCLESVTAKRVRSYAAPAGVHPQPGMTDVLDGLGIEGYYYTGDSGGPVVRPFYNGKLVSDRSWAFPVMPDGKVASIGEMRDLHLTEAPVERWLDENAAYAAERHGIFLMYSHSYDLLPSQYVAAYYTAERRRVPLQHNSAYDVLPSPYAVAFGHFLDRVEVLERAGRLRTTDMPSAAAFMDRFVATTSSFMQTADGVRVNLHNDDGLQSIAFAVPAAWLKTGAPLPIGVRRTSTDGGYAIFAVDSNLRDLDVTFPGAS